MIINAIVFRIVCVCVVLNSWTMLRQPVWLTWKIIWFPVKFYLLSFCFTVHTRIEIVCDYYYCYYYMCARVCLQLFIWFNYRFHCYSFNCMIMLASFSIRWSRLFYQFRAQFWNLTKTKPKVPFYLWFSFLSLLKFSFVVCFDGIHMYIFYLR